MIRSIENFTNICKLSQKDLKVELNKKLVSLGYTEIVDNDGYIFAKGEIPILLTAHMDTVHENLPEEVYITGISGETTISSPQGIGGDDRCGVFIILNVVKESELKPSILFCEDEEIGRVGSKKFCKDYAKDDLNFIKYFVELDRTDKNDAVYYSCGNDDFEKFIEDTIGYKKDYGSYSDISELMPHFGIAGVNLSCGYYNAHTTKEFVIFEEMERTIDAVKVLLTTESEQFEYIEKTYADWYSYPYYGNRYGRCYGNYYDDDYDDYYSVPKTSKKKLSNKEDYSLKSEVMIYVTYCDVYGNEKQGIGVGETKMEALADFMLTYTDVSIDMIYDYSFELS